MKKEKVKNSIYGKLDRSRFLFIYLCILFPVCQFIVFFIFVNINSILLAFQTDDGAFTLNNFNLVLNALKGTYQPAAGAGAIGVALKHSVILWLWSKLLVYPISLVSTYILFKKIWGHYVFRVIFTLPSVIGATIWVSTLQLVSDYNGILVQICNGLGIPLTDNILSGGFIFNPDTAFPTMVIYTVIGVVGGDVVLTGAFSRVPAEIFESARIDGAGFWRECVQIAIPCVGSTISTILTFALCSFFVADCNAFLYTRGAAGNYNAETMGFYFLQLQVVAKETQTYTFPAAVGVSVSLITVPFVLFGRWLLDKIFPPTEF